MYIYATDHSNTNEEIIVTGMKCSTECTQLNVICSHTAQFILLFITGGGGTYEYLPIPGSYCCIYKLMFHCTIACERDVPMFILPVCCCLLLMQNLSVSQVLECKTDDKHEGGHMTLKGSMKGKSNINIIHGVVVLVT